MKHACVSFVVRFYRLLRLHLAGRRVLTTRAQLAYDSSHGWPLLSQLSNTQCEKQTVLNKCSNPGCLEEFHSLRSGRLFVTGPANVGTTNKASTTSNPGRLEYFWLCSRCCKTMRITVDPDHRVVVTSLHDPATIAPVSVAVSPAFDRR